jgi:hypothetical protein
VTTEIGYSAVAIESSPVMVTAVSPGATPVTTPAPSTVAMVGSALLKV